MPEKTRVSQRTETRRSNFVRLKRLLLSRTVRSRIRRLWNTKSRHVYPCVLIPESDRRQFFAQSVFRGFFCVVDYQYLDWHLSKFQR